MAEITLPGPATGEVLVRNELMSVDPYIRLTLDTVMPLHRRLGGAVHTCTVALAGLDATPQGLVELFQGGHRGRILARR